MKLKDVGAWVSVVVGDRVILFADLHYMSAGQREALLNLEVVKIGRGRFYSV